MYYVFVTCIDTLTHVNDVTVVIVNLIHVPAANVFTPLVNVGEAFAPVALADKFGVLEPATKTNVAGGQGVNDGVLRNTLILHDPAAGDTISHPVIVHAYGTLT
jgi:hypothetical protein